MIEEIHNNPSNTKPQLLPTTFATDSPPAINIAHHEVKTKPRNCIDVQVHHLTQLVEKKRQTKTNIRIHQRSGFNDESAGTTNIHEEDGASYSSTKIEAS